MTKTKPAYIGTPEVSVMGVQKKGTGAPTRGTIKSTPRKTEARGKSWLRTYIGTVIVVDALVGMTIIYGLFDSPDEVRTQAHAMWLFGVSHLTALVPVLLFKLE